MIVDVHALDQPFTEHIPMLDGVLGTHLASAIAHNLEDRHDNLTVGSMLDAPRLHARVDQIKLPLPVFPHLLVAVQVSALHPVGPIDISMHHREDPIDVARVERLVGEAQHTLVRLAHRPTS